MGCRERFEISRVEPTLDSEPPTEKVGCRRSNLPTLPRECPADEPSHHASVAAFVGENESFCTGLNCEWLSEKPTDAAFNTQSFIFSKGPCIF